MQNNSRPEPSPVQGCCPNNIGAAGFKMSFLPCFLLPFLYNEVQCFPLGREPLCRPRGEQLGKQTCS